MADVTGLSLQSSILRPMRRAQISDAPPPSPPDQQACLTPAADVLITGIPRSGTSFFTSSLHKLENCVGINEPEEIFRHLDDTCPPWGMASFYRSLRTDIGNGHPITNKIIDGTVIEDTAVLDVEKSYVPPITGTDFLLATKNTLGYLARIPFLVRAMPDATFVACVRDPYSTIASWKGTFAHLREAAPRFRKGFVGDKLMRPTAQQRLEVMARTESIELRRALLWTHLALLIIEDIGVFAHIFRYEDFVINPLAQLQMLLHRIPKAPPLRLRQPLEPSQPRASRAGNLTPADVEAIQSVCAEVATALGYDVSFPVHRLA